MMMRIDKIICVGKNYLDHARELGDAIPEKPVIFLKPVSILKQASQWNTNIYATLPSHQGEVHYECEIVLRVCQSGYCMTRELAEKALDAVTIGLDMTLRDVQTKLKKNGHPWTIGKVFPDAAMIGPWILLQDFPDFMTTPFSLTLDGKLRQQDCASSMMIKPVDLLVYISQFFPLCAGDLIFTGTPAGVGAVHPGSKAQLQWGDYQYEVCWN